MFPDGPEEPPEADQSASAQGLAMVGMTRKMARNAAVYTVHVGFEHSHVSRSITLATHGGLGFLRRLVF